MKDGVIMQLAPPEDIYNDPVNVYVAGFIGSPSMNLIEVNAEATWATAENGVRIQVSAPRQGALTMGIRAEDMQLTSAQDANFSAELFAFELLGDSTMVTIKFGHTGVAVKGDKNLRLKFGDRVGVRFDPARLYWFDSNTGLRIR
jgi:multiple sugar transport system ATP-binding protein